MLHKIQNVLYSKSKFYEIERKCSRVNNELEFKISNCLNLCYFVFLACKLTLILRLALKKLHTRCFTTTSC